MPRVYRRQRIWLARFVRRCPLGAAAGIAILGLTALAGLANQLAPYDPLANDFGTMFAAPDARHWFGTDAFGRDVLSRVLYGARTALLVGFAASLVGATIGGIVGVRSEEHTSELQSLRHLVCRLLLEKKK